MKRALVVLGVLLVGVGLIWFLQGIGVLQGSFMSNQAQWALIGLLAGGIGTGILVGSLRRASNRDQQP